MLKPLIGATGELFGWACEGDIYDPEFNQIAFSSGDDVFAISDRKWLGPTHDGAIYDLEGRAVAVPPGMLPLGIGKPRIKPLQPRIGPASGPLPCDMRQAFNPDGVATTRRWDGLTLSAWLGQH